METPQEQPWVVTLLESTDHKCGNCGSDDGITVKMIVPEEAGGKKVPSNGVVLCKTCRFHSERVFKEDRVPMCFFLPRALHARLVEYCDREKTSLSSVIRGLVSHFISADYSTFEPIWAYQESERDVKVNVQVNTSNYYSFRDTLVADRRTVQEAMVSLLYDFLEKTETVNV